MDKVRDEIDRQDEYIRSLDSTNNTPTSHRGNNNNNNSPSQSVKRSLSVPSTRPKHISTSHTLSSPVHAHANQNKARRNSVKATSTSSNNGKRSNDVSIITDTTLSFDADGFMAGVSSYQPRGSVAHQNNGTSQLSASRRQSSSQGQGEEQKGRVTKLSPKRVKKALLNVGVKAMSSTSTGNELKSTKTQQQLASMVMEVRIHSEPIHTAMLPLCPRGLMSPLSHISISYHPYITLAFTSLPFHSVSSMIFYTW